MIRRRVIVAGHCNPAFTAFADNLCPVRCAVAFLAFTLHLYEPREIFIGHAVLALIIPLIGVHTGELPLTGGMIHQRHQTDAYRVDIIVKYLDRF